MAEFKLEFPSNFFENIGRMFAKEFSTKVKAKQNFDGSGGYSPLKHKRPKGHKQGLNTRLNDSGDLRSRAFDYEKIGDLSVRIFVTNEYADIVRYNNAGSPSHNTNINKPVSYVFPVKGKESDIERMQSYKKVEQMFQQAMDIQSGKISAALKLDFKPVTMEFPFGPKS